MKTLMRIFLVLIVLFVLVASAGYLLLSRPAFQKRLVESRLPEGSSVQFVQVSPGSLELTDLNLILADGTSAQLDSLRSDFSPMAALLDDTIELRGLKVDGLVVKLPEVSTSVTSATPVRATSPSAVSEPQGASISSEANPAAAPAKSSSSALDELYALGDLGLLFDIDSIEVNGALIDASRNRYAFELKSDSIAPGAQSTLEAKLQLDSKQALQGGLQEFSSELRIILSQKESGGFEQVRVESQTSGSDANGATLLAIAQTMDLSMNAFEQTADLAVSFNADLPHPEVFAPELIALQGLSLRGELHAVAEGDALTLQNADFEATSNGAPVASIKLKQSFTLGTEQKIVGDLMLVDLIQLPLAWLNPWLDNGMQLSGAALSTQVVMSGEASGALEIKTLAPIQLGPLSLYQDQQIRLQEVSLRMNPVIRIEADQSIHFDLGDFQLLDTYGGVVSGQISGSRSSSDGSSPLDGIQARAKLDLGLADLLQQPAFAGMASVLAGQAKLDLEVDGAAEYPAKLQAAITGLRARELPGSRQDYRLAAQLKQSGNASYALGSNFQAGSESRPSTSVQLVGQVNLEQQPMPFKLSLTGPNVLQSDIDLLLAALQSQEVVTAPSSGTGGNWAESPVRPSASTVSPVAAASTPVANAAPQPSPAAGASATSLASRPPWADLDGEVAIQLDSLTLASGQTVTGLNAKAIISEALLRISDFAATLEGGGFGGDAEVTYDAAAEKAYQLSSTLNFKNVDPMIFSQKGSGSFPVNGLFDGAFNLKGSGTTLEQAVEDSEADLIVTGREGVLTAFELDDRSQLGLLGASILGQTLNRPGLTAMANAVPYFKEMNFDTFKLELVRAQDKQVRIQELSFIGDNLRIAGEGLIAASSLSEVLDQPLDLTLGLAAKGQLINYLETLQLLAATTSEDGFRDWNQDINIGGTLGDPDTSALKELLNTAARSALSKPTKSSSSESDTVTPSSTDTQTPDATTEEKEKSKDEQRRDDIEMGLDLINSLFG
jgi:hypothetical protein